MMRNWIGIALLAGSWLMGLGYFQPADLAISTAFLLAAVLVFEHFPVRLPSVGVRVASLLLLVPAIWCTPTPYGSGPILMAIGVLLTLLPIPRPRIRQLGRGAIICGAILCGQAIAMTSYLAVTARIHMLPSSLGQCLGWLLKGVGLDTAVDRSVLVIRSGLDSVEIALTWELLFDPASICFVVGGLIVISMDGVRTLGRLNRRHLRRHDAVMLFVACVVWAPIRLAVLVSLVVHQTLIGGAEVCSNGGELLVNRWLHVVLLIGNVVLVHWLIFRRDSNANAVPRSGGTVVHPAQSNGRLAVTAVLFAFGVMVLGVCYYWVPVGQRQSGRVMVVERHSTWEPTTHLYDTECYGEEGSYNYGAIFEYCRQYYQMMRLEETESLSRVKLDQCDVLIIKTPTSRYDESEINAVLEFVSRGGSLLLIGDHTNVFNMNTYLNDIARHLGFTFRNDLLFRIGDPYDQKYQPPWVPHPMVQHVPSMHFAVSCSIDPGLSVGRMAIRNVGMWSLPPAYNESNYHPQAEYRPNLRCGAWCQSWVTTFGEGRVVAFADSTLFSNFCTFQPGKKELFLGMVEWLNHRSAWDRPVWRSTLVFVLCIVGGTFLVIGSRSTRLSHGNWILLIALASATWATTASATHWFHQKSMPWPMRSKSIPHIVIDRDLSAVPLFIGAFADDDSGTGYGMLEQWIPRVGNFISRETGSAVFQGDGLVIICPTKIPSLEYREQLFNYVECGGRLLIFDTPDVVDSTANSLLALFGMFSNRETAVLEGQSVRLLGSSIAVPIRASAAILGGEPIAQWGELPVAARRSVGRGSVAVVGFGSLFNDASMGFHWLAEPEPDVLARYELLYGLLEESLR